LAKKIPVNAILDEIRDNLTGVLCRDHLTTRQDIQNIMQQYNLNLVQKHSEDATSINCWVKDLQDKDYNCILCYKPQGIEKYGLPDSDFLLGLQTEFQRGSLVNYGEKLICIDSTHSTTGYDFLLVTVLIKDEFGEGVPVAWLITNREDICSLDPFFSSLNERIGNIVVTDFMSDDADAFYNAWTRNFPAPRRRLLCAWHVDKALSKNIFKHISDVGEQAHVYKIVKTLQIETNEVVFKTKLLEFCSLAEESYPKFYDYFKNEFLKRERLWAYCFRESTAANTNMALESFHRVLKSVYFNRKRNRRVDNLLSELLKIARDKAFEAWAKFEKGKRTNKIRDIDQRHKMSLQIDKTQIEHISELEWRCPSQSVDGKYYFIVKGDECTQCRMKCSYCSVCIHVYSCSCPDYMIRSVPCKHVHATHMLTDTDIDVLHNDRKDFQELSSRKRSYFQRQIGDHDLLDSGIATKKRDARKVMETITRKLESTNDSAIVNAVHGHLKNALSVLNGMLEDVGTLELRENIPVNKHFEKQTRFFSTKRKPKQKPKVLEKPTAEDKEGIFQILEGHTANLCGICLEEDDRTNSNAVNWIACSRCGLWCHCSCIKNHTECSDFICIACQK